MCKVKSSLLKVFIVLVTFFISSMLFGQNQVVFEQLTAKDGLSNGTINSIFKDSRGFIWFCTDDGLNRYDGYTFKIYKPEQTENTQAKNIQFFTIVEDVYGRIWIGTSIGLLVYNPIDDSIISFADLSNIDLSNNPIVRVINSLLIDSFNNLWIGTYYGILRMKISNQDIETIKEENITQFNTDSNDSLRISNNYVFSFLEDKQHQIWVSSNSDQLDCYNYERNNFTHHKIEIKNIDKYKRLNKEIIADKDDNFWISTRGFGLIYWDRHKQTFSQLKTLSNDNELIDISHIRCLMIDHLDRIWIGTDGNGLVVFNKKRNEINHYSKNIEDQSNLSSNAIYSIFEDSSGIFWIGTYIMGLNKFVSDKLNFGTVYSSPYSKTGLSHNIVTSFCEDKNNQIWISTDGGGINSFNRKTHQFKHYKHDPANKESISINATMSLFCDRDNTIWIASYKGGLNRFDTNTEIFYHYWHDLNDSTSISSNHPWGFAQDKLNNLWIATVDAGLNLLKPGSNSFVRYINTDENNLWTDQLCSNSMTQLFIDKNNCLWIGTEHGLDKIDLNKVDFNLSKPNLIFEHYRPSENGNSLSSYQISCINEDSLGNLWIGTKGGGLNKLNLKTQNFTHFSSQDGLPHNVINGILFDRDNNLWISTNNGLSNFNIETQKFKNYNISDGLQSAVFVKTSYLKTNDGMFLFGGINGFNAFYPERIATKILVINPVITNFNLFNQSVVVGEKINDRIILTKAISVLDEITLFYRENSFAFEFSALDFSSPEKIHYSYKLSGFDKEWQITDSKMRIAKYTNLAPGEYTFSVKASTNEEIWPESETSIVIIIRPPWWKTLWFRIIAAVFAIAFWALFFTVRVYRLEKQKSILKSKVEEKTIELREANNKKDKFLSIIAHDLINPFNSILGFTDILLTNYYRWDDKSRIETITTINDSSNELYELLGNLLQWSRSERGLLEYIPEKIDLNNCIFKITSLFSVTAKSKNINIDVKFSDLCYQVKSDIQLLNAILRNLISNSIKFTSEGGQITIKTECIANYIEVTVTDNGVGIGKDRLDNLFRIDIQHSTPGTKDEKGTGLGLFLVKEFVKKQLGTLSIKSEKGIGSTFSFTVPLWNEEPAGFKQKLSHR